IPILSRLLSPEDYGVVGMAMPFVLFAMMLADAGIAVSLVRTPATERQVWSTSFWLTALLGLGLAVCMMAIAPVAAWVFAEEKLSPIVMALSAAIIIQSLGSVPGAALQQQQRFRLMAGIEIVALLCGIATAVGVALSGGGAWALVFQQLVFYGVKVAPSFYYSGFRPLFSLQLAGAKEHLTFSRNVLSVNVIGFFTRSMDNLIIGKMLGAASVGVYAMAFQFARLPIMLISGPLNMVLYARLSQVKEDIVAVRHTFMVLSRLLATVVFPGMGMVAAAHGPVFDFLLSEKWAQAGVVFMLAAPACATLSVTMLCGTIMLVLGRADTQLKTTYEFGFLWIGVLCISALFGVEWAAASFNVAVWAYTPRLLSLVLPLMGASAQAYARALATPLVVTCACVAGYVALVAIATPAAWAQMVLGALFALLGMGAAFGLQWKALREEMRHCGHAFGKFSKAVEA
ncbi:MAG: lipopolysaccharide biosynthesis protein, partial [Rickettsiales bacterium]|nr:lipopolysaccharide biosynthesis protein [Rickettsiales bacterium]